MAYYLAGNYKKYDYGGITTGVGANNQTLRSAMGIAQAASGAIDGLNQPDNFGYKSVGASTASGALKGASVGAVAGPWGAAIGAVVGAGYGFFSSKAGNTKAGRAKFGYLGRIQDNQRMRSQATLAQNPELTEGNVGTDFYAHGGRMNTIQLPDGGSFQELSDDSMAVSGPSHEQGGVQLPGTGAEVEGGETINKDFVFSERLGFAQEHRKIAKAIGRIEQKPQTIERRNSIQRLEQRQEKLKQGQEYFKHVLAHFGQPVEAEEP